ncbi:MAG: HPP family protein [Armatimonadetes bacterium]|nr:HPP family protein [Armatimonadota bacterium]
MHHPEENNTLVNRKTTKPQHLSEAGFFKTFFRTIERCPARPSTVEILLSASGCISGIGIISYLAFHYSLPLLLASFGATAALVYGVPDNPFSQPRNVIGGHLISATTGVLLYHLAGTTWWSITLAVSAAIVLMMVARSFHPPGGATAFIAVWNAQGYLFIFAPVFVGAVLLVLIALLINNIGNIRYYPRYW